MCDAVVITLYQIYVIGKVKHETFVQSKLVDASTFISNTIPRNSMPTFVYQPSSKKKSVGKLEVLKRNTSLVTQLFLSLQSSPDLNFSDFFKFENHFEPPALASKGMVRTGTKSDILECLGDPKSACKEAKKTTIHILDMAAVIHMVRPIYATTFIDFVTNNLIPFLKSQISDKVERLDAIWDTYPEHTLKAHAQEMRGSGPRTKLSPNGDTPIPKRDWQKYLKYAENKSELFSFCSQKLAETQLDNILIFTTLKEELISNKAFDISFLSPCNHHEADTHIILHLAHASKEGHKEAYVCTVDSDIVVLAMVFFDKLNFSKLWIGFGCGKYYRDIPIHELYAALGPERSHAHPLFHVLNGCDTTSHILGCGKKTVWGAW